MFPYDGQSTHWKHLSLTSRYGSSQPVRCRTWKVVSTCSYLGLFEVYTTQVVLARCMCAADRRVLRRRHITVTFRSCKVYLKAGGPVNDAGQLAQIASH